MNELPEQSLSDWHRIQEEPMDCQYACQSCPAYGCPDRIDHYAAPEEMDYFELAKDLSLALAKVG